jgi:hypothetical protein
MFYMSSYILMPFVRVTGANKGVYWYNMNKSDFSLVGKRATFFPTTANFKHVGVSSDASGNIYLVLVDEIMIIAKLDNTGAP